MEGLVGREAVLGRAAAFLDRISDGPTALVIDGEVGLGKTAVWLHTVAAAEARGYRVLRARPAESEATLAYSGIADLVSAVFEEVKAVLPPPQQRALAAALLLADGEEPAAFRATATAFVNVLAALAAEETVVVAIDDVQWIDPASERVLAFAARRLPSSVALLLTRRIDPGAGHVGLVRSLPSELVVRVGLEPLSLAALHHLIHEQTGISLVRPMLTRLAAASGGNPLFALEIGRLLEARPDHGGLGEPLPVPSTLQELVAARVDALSPPTRAAVLAAAALSRPTAAIVAAASDRAGDADAALAEAEEAGVLVSDRGRIHFTHPLLASAVYGATSAQKRRRLHRRLADVVDDLEERARHLAMGIEGADEAAAAELERAAERAALRGAQEAAAELFDGSCALTPAQLPDDLARRRLGQAAALNAIGDFPGARAVAELALATAHSPASRAAALSLLARLAWHDGAARTATEHAEEALIEAGSESPLQGEIRAQLVRFNFSFDLDRALDHAGAAAAVLDEEREPGLLAHVLVDRFFGSALAGREAPRALLERGLALEARALAALSGTPQPMPLLWFHCSDDFAAARDRYVMEDQWYRDRGEDVSVADRMSHFALAELRAGHWDAAERLVEESCATLDGMDVRGPRAMAFEKRALVDAHRGRADRSRETLQPLIEQFERSGQVWWAALSLSTLAFTEFADGDERAADDALRRMREHADAVGVTDVLFDRSEPFHVEALLALGELERARETLQRLEERGRRLPRLWITATLPRVRALVVAAERNVTDALAILDAPDAATTPTLAFEQAWTMLVKGRLHRRAKQKRAAADALKQALETFERLGAPAFAARARADLDRVGLRRAPTGLTPSELRIAELVAAGRTNREAAQAAFVSQKTVEANLARVYRKLGIRSRAELAAQMAVQRDGPPQT